MKTRGRRLRVPPSARRFAALAAVVVLTFLLWDTWVTWPVQMLVVFVHECGHALAAVLTGGEVRGLRIGANLGGRAHTVGGIPFLILQAGYLASALFGAVLIVAAARPGSARNTLLSLAAILAGCALAFVRPLLGPTLLFALVMAALFVWAARSAPENAVRWGLLYLACVSALYALADIREDLLHWDSGRRSDATLLADRTGIPALVWGVLWATLALAILGTAVRTVHRRGWIIGG